MRKDHSSERYDSARTSAPIEGVNALTVPVRRTATGSIDMEFYDAQAHRLRAQAVGQWTATITSTLSNVVRLLRRWGAWFVLLASFKRRSTVRHRPWHRHLERVCIEAGGHEGHSDSESSDPRYPDNDVGYVSLRSHRSAPCELRKHISTPLCGDNVISGGASGSSEHT